MRELKVYHHELRHNEYEEFYLKYEADKVIALLTDKANYNEYAYKLKSEELADTCRFYEDEIRRQKYKRCLAKAERCKAEQTYSSFAIYITDHPKSRWANKSVPVGAWFAFWKNREQRWLELAEKFKM